MLRENFVRRGRRNRKILFLVSLMVIVLSQILQATSSPLSIVRELDTVVEKNHEINKVEEFTRQYCGSAIDHISLEDQKFAFSSYIYRGDAVSRYLLHQLQKLLDPGVLDMVLAQEDLHHLNASKLNFFQIIRPVRFLLCCGVLVIILLLIAIVLLPACCSSCWRNCLGACFCRKCCRDRERTRPIQNISKKKQNSLLRKSIFSIIISIILIVTSAAFSIKMAFSVPSALCQISRLTLEITEGVKYNQQPNESSWLKGLPENAEFVGFQQTKDNLQNVQKEFDTERKLKGGVLIQRLDNVISILNFNLKNEVLQTVEKSLAEIGSKKVNNEEWVYQPSYAVLAGHPRKSKTLNSGIYRFIKNGTKKVDLTSRATRSQLDRFGSSLHKPLKDVERTIIGAEKRLTRARDRFLEIVRLYHPLIKDVADSSYISFLVISLLPLVGVIFEITMSTLLLKHRKKGTEPKHKTYCRWFAFFWGWFAITGCILFFLYSVIMVVLSVTNSACKRFEDVATKPEIFSEYNLTKRFYSSNHTRWGVDTCLRNEGDGQIAKLFFVNNTDQIYQVLNKTKETFHSIQKEPKNVNSYRSLLDNLRDLEANSLIRPLNSKHISFTPSIFLLPREIIFSGVFEDRIELKQSEHKYYEKIFGEGISNLDSLLKADKQLEKFATTCHVGQWVVEDARTIYSFEDHLNKMTAYSRDACKNSMGIKFCVADFKDDTKRICSGSGMEPGIDLTSIKLNEDFAPQWSYGKYNITGMKFLQKALGDSCPEPKSMESFEPGDNCSNLQYFSLYSGAFFANLKWHQYKATPQKDINHIVTVARIVENFEERTKRAAADVDQICQAGYSVVEGVQNGTNCKVLTYSMGSVVDGVCGGIQQDLNFRFLQFWIAHCWGLIGAGSWVFWIICYKLFHYFKDRHNAENSLEGRLTSLKPLSSPSTLLAYAHCGNEKEVEQQLLLVNHKTALDNNFNTALHHAAYSGNCPTVQKLLDHNAEINQKNDFGFTPLGVAAAKGHSSVVSILIKRGADPTIQDGFGDTPLHAAARGGDIEVVKALCDKPAPVPVYVNDENEVAVDTAHYSKNVEVEAFLDIKTPKTTFRATEIRKNDSKNYQ